MLAARVCSGQLHCSFDICFKARSLLLHNSLSGYSSSRLSVGQGRMGLASWRCLLMETSANTN